MPTKTPGSAPVQPVNVKPSKSPITLIEKQPQTFADRLKKAEPDTMFMAPDRSAIAVVGVVVDGVTERKMLIGFKMDGTAPTWAAAWLDDDVTLPDDWTLHQIDHVNFEFRVEEK
jgi:hypothetical protein